MKYNLIEKIWRQFLWEVIACENIIFWIRDERVMINDQF